MGQIEISIVALLIFSVPQTPAGIHRPAIPLHPRGCPDLPTNSGTAHPRAPPPIPSWPPRTHFPPLSSPLTTITLSPVQLSPAPAHLHPNGMAKARAKTSFQSQAKWYYSNRTRDIKQQDTQAHRHMDTQTHRYINTQTHAEKTTKHMTI